jgi:hypothetical protein
MNHRLVAVIVCLPAAGLVGCKDARGARGVAATTAGPTGSARTAVTVGPAGPNAQGLAGIKADSLAASREQLQAIEQVTAALNRIQDDATVAAALPDLRIAAGRLRAANQRMMDVQKEFPNVDPATAEQILNDPEVQQQMEKVIDATGRMLDANFNAQLKAPNHRTEIQKICDSANVDPKPKGPGQAPRGRPQSPGK